MPKLKLNLGSVSKPKLQAVEDAFLKYFPEIALQGFPVSSGVSYQPMGLNEILQGAKVRAHEAFKARKCDYSIGLEAGWLDVPGTNTGYMDIAFCVIFDGKKSTFGGSPLFELPHKVVQKVVHEKKELGLVFPELWPHLPHSNDPNHKEAIRFLSKDVVKRSALLEMAVLMALLPIVSKDDFYDF
ncbi:MAG: inosine/xanthosine triphosphatase [Candidatus Diapherotrites archaeon]|nr:inosine/xanthosine triphosphatase [Candidatus Diapherotrites archaeon]